MHSVLIIDIQKRSGIISEFQRLYIKTGVFPKEASGIIASAFNVRTNSDYNDFYYADHTDIEQQLVNAESFLKMVSGYIDSVFSDA